MIAVDIVGYIETPRGMKALKTVWAEHIGEECQEKVLQELVPVQEADVHQVLHQHQDHVEPA